MRPTVKQMAESLKAAPDVDLNTLLNVVLGTCVQRGFLDMSVALAVIVHVSSSVYKCGPERALQEAERLLREMQELESPS